MNGDERENALIASNQVLTWILTDLIAELRACQLPPRAADAADRAKQRLREVRP